MFKQNNMPSYTLVEFKGDQKAIKKCLQNQTCTAIIDKETLITNDTSRIIILDGLKEPLLVIRKNVY